MAGPSNYRRLALYAAAILVIGLALFSIGRSRSIAVAYYTDALRSSGNLIDVSSETDFDALRTAYAKSLASRADYTRLVGADVDLLYSMIDRLESVLAQIADAQPDGASRRAIRSLYPTSYLRALAKAEEARRAFVRSGSVVDGNEYYALLESALSAGVHDVAEFIDAFEDVGAGGNNATPTGIITTENTRSYSLAVKQSLLDQLAMVRSERACFRGHIESCRPTVEPTESTVVSTDHQLDLSLTREVAGLAYEGIGLERPTTPLFTLASSACAAQLTEAPYAFMADDVDEGRVPHVRFVGDLVFYSPHAVQAPVLDYLEDELGASRIHLNPLKFYVCPEAISDISRVLALRHISMYAAASGSAPDAFADGVISDQEALDYLGRITSEPSAMGHTEADELRRELLTTRRLDAVLQEIVRVHEKNISSLQSGVPFDIDARTLLFTHNALASLYPPIPDVPIADVPSRMKDRLDAATELYSEIRGAVSRAEILNDLERYAEFDDSAQ